MSCKSNSFTLKARRVTALVPQTSAPSRCEPVDPLVRLRSRAARVTRGQSVGRLVALAVNNSDPFLAKSKDGRCNPDPIDPCRLEWLAGGVAATPSTPTGTSRSARAERQIPRAKSHGETLEISLSARPDTDDGAGRSRSRRARANPAAILVDGALGASSPSGRPLPHSRGGASGVLAGQREAHGAPSARRADPRCTRPELSKPRPVAILAAAAATGRARLAGFLRPLHRDALRVALSAFLTRPLPHHGSELASNA
jgi:hypothetical protein